VSSVESTVIVGVGTGLVVIHCLSAGRRGARVAHDTETSEQGVADITPEDSAAPPPSDWLARSIRTGMLVLALGALYLAVSVGLIQRKLWAGRC